MRKKAIILAAGMGERLVSGKAYPKPLQPVAGVPLIVRVLKGLDMLGVEEVGVIVGHLGDVLIAGIQRERFRLDVQYIWNDEYEKPNGTSLLKARAFVTEPTLMMMSDHLWSPHLVQRVADAAIGPEESALGVDRAIERCIDLPDATKVWMDKGRVVHISKSLERYNALDTGVFCITPTLMDVLADVNGARGCSLSQGVEVLAGRGAMHAVDVGDARWVDVDTAQTHAEAERLVAAYGDSLGA